MQSQSKEWAFGAITTAIALVAATYFFFMSQIDHMLGGNTEVVDVSQFRPISGNLAITDISVISTDLQSMRSNQTVLINNTKIESVGEGITIPANYHVINGTGQYLIPGLVDSHVHIKKSKNDLLLYIANGVTQVGEMTGMEQHFEYAKQIENGAIGPYIFIASPKLTSQTGMKPILRSQFEKRHQNISSPLEARKAVRELKSMNYDAIKLSSDLSADIYFAINDEAKKLGIPVIGHLPAGLSMDDLYRSGQSQLAHMDSITLNLMKEFGGFTSENSEAYLIYLKEHVDSVAAKLKQNNISIATTSWLFISMPKQDFELAKFLKSIELEYQNPGWIEGSLVSRGCLPGDNSYENPHNADPESQHEWETYWHAYNQAIAIMTRALIRHDVTITAGTDALGACGMIAGFSLHNELETLKNIGLTNAQVLYSATIAPAEWMGTDTGKVKSGYRADLVLLDKNPLKDIRNTRSINAVITNGKYLDRTQLDKILEAVKEANNRSREVSIGEFIEG